MKIRDTLSIAGLTLALSLTACAAGLRGPAQDHAIVTRVVVDSCKSEDKSKCTAEDLEAVAEQAECIARILEGRDCE